MTDVRHLNQIEIELDDPNYLIKLLSSVPIVRWNKPKTQGQVYQRSAEEVSDLIQAYKAGPAGGGGALELLLEDDECEEAIAAGTKEILYMIFPPQEWIQDNTRYLQTISTVPASRLETADLKEAVRAYMIRAQARIKGICPVRENLTMRCFDEMIRLATIDCIERGLLLRGVRDEIRMTVMCYKTLVRSAVEFGENKFQSTVDKLGDLQKELQDLREEKQRFHNENQEMRVKMRLMERQFSEERHAIMESRKAKLAALKRTCDQFITMLDAVGVEKHQYRHLLQ